MNMIGDKVGIDFGFGKLNVFFYFVREFVVYELLFWNYNMI